VKRLDAEEYGMDMTSSHFDLPTDLPAGLRVLLLPGWQDSGPGHWQAHWAKRPGFVRVEQDDWLWPRRGDWMAQLDAALLADARPALLVDGEMVSWYGSRAARGLRWLMALRRGLA